MQKATSTVRGTGPLLMPEIILNRIPGVVNRVGWTDMVSQPGWLIGREPESGDIHLYELSAAGLQVARVWSVDLAPQAVGQIRSGVQGLVSGEVLAAADSQQAVLLYSEQAGLSAADSQTQGGPVAGPSARIFLLTKGTDQTFEAISLSDMPSFSNLSVALLADPKLQLLSGGRQLLIVGERDGEVVAQRIDLINATSMTRPLNLAPGFCWASDPVSGRIYAFGGATGSGAALVCGLSIIDPVDLSVTRIGSSQGGSVVAGGSQAGQDGGPTGRRSCGMAFDQQTRSLLLAGGIQGNDQLSDLWRFDLATRGWHEVSEGAGQPLTNPLIWPWKGRIWLADTVGENTADGLTVLTVAETGGQWTQTTAFRFGTNKIWPIDELYVPGAVSAALYGVGSDQPWPGKLLLATLQGQGLGFDVYGPNGERLSRSETILADDESQAEQQAAFLCPPNSACLLAVRGRKAVADPVSFHLDVQPGLLTAAGQAAVHGKVHDLLVWGNTVFAASSGGLTVFDRQGGDLTKLRSIDGCGLGAARGLAACGGQYLCVARMGLVGLVVVDVSDPATMELAGGTWTLGPGWDLATDGTNAYVAHGWFGLGIYDITNPTHPSWKNQIWPSGKIVAVTRRADILAVGSKQGRITLYRIGPGGLDEIGRIQAHRGLAWLRFEGNRLWAAGQRWDWARLYDVADPGQPTLLAQVQADAVQWARRWMLGNHVLTFEGHKVRLDEIVTSQ